MAFDIKEFKRLVTSADHGVFRSFNQSKSALRDLIPILEKGNSGEHRKIADALKHIPADKRAKYRSALVYLESNYPGLSAPGLSAAESKRVFRAGDDVTIIKSPLADTTDCVIFGHAGQVPDDQRFNGTFPIPFGLTLHFYTIHGQANRTSPGHALKQKPDDNDISLQFDRANLISYSDSTKKGAPALTVRHLENSIETVTRDHRGTHTKTARFETPQTDVRNAKGALVRDSDGKALQKPGQKQVMLEKASLTNKKANKLLRGNDPLEGKLFGPAQPCFNYVVKNGLGMHWTSDNVATKAPWKAADMVSIQDTLLASRQALPGGASPVDRDKSWVPHFVFIHSESVVRLNDLITRSHFFIAMDENFNRPVEHFYFAGCRGIHVGWNPGTED